MPEREFGPVAIQALRFQVEAYRKFGIISHWLIDKKKNFTRLAEKKFKAGVEVIVTRRILNFNLKNLQLYILNTMIIVKSLKGARDTHSWESSNLAPTSGYKNETAIRPYSRSCKVLRARV